MILPGYSHRHLASLQFLGTNLPHNNGQFGIRLWVVDSPLYNLNDVVTIARVSA